MHQKCKSIAIALKAFRNDINLVRFIPCGLYKSRIPNFDICKNLDRAKCIDVDI